MKHFEKKKGMSCVTNAQPQASSLRFAKRGRVGGLTNYNDFKDDVEYYLKECIELYDLKFDNQIVVRLNEMPQHFICLRNENVLLTVNNIEIFPYQDVVPHFYFEENSNLIEIKDELLKELLGINTNQFKEYCLKHYQTYNGKNEFSNNEKGGYLYGLFSINDLILKFYRKLFTGDKSYKNYLELLKKTGIDK